MGEDRQRSHKTYKYINYNEKSILELSESVGSEVGRSLHSYEVCDTCRWTFHLSFTDLMIKNLKCPEAFLLASQIQNIK